MTTVTPLARHVLDTLRPIPNYPKPGIIFQDITPVLRDGPLFRAVVEAMADPFRDADVTHVLGIEARGFILGGAVATSLGAGFVPARKPGKLPWERVAETYDLEYGTDALECHRDGLPAPARVLIVDDVLATGGTARAAGQLARALGAEVVGWSFLLEIARPRRPGEAGRRDVARRRSALMRRVLAIGLDAAEPRLIERWTDDGTLPTLRRLRAEGRYGRLTSSAAYLSGSPWPTFFAGRTPAQHGRYSYLGWRPEAMRVARPTAEYLPAAPFWHTLGERGRRVVAIDIPLTYAPTTFDGVQVSNWATHEALEGPATFPAGLMASLRREFGPPGRTYEEFGLLPLDRLLEIGAQQCDLVGRLGMLARGLMRRERWDLFLVAFAGTHRGGHKLWDATAVEGPVAPAHSARLEEALRRIYVRTDRAVGELLDTAGSDVSVLVFSLHGMGENTSRSDLLPEILRRVLAGGEAAPRSPDRGLTARLRHRMPGRWRNTIKARLPLPLQDRLTAFWSMGRRRWGETRAFCLVSDLQGYVRVNVRGREARGIVEPGPEYDQLVEEIRRGIGSFVDADSGEPVAHRVTRADQLYPSGERRHLLPDLIVQWSRTPVAPQRRIVSPRFGTIDREFPGKNANGRAGNHRPEGFLIASGAGVEQGSIRPADILDLAPTIFALLGLAPPAEMSGRPIDLRGTA